MSHMEQCRNVWFATLKVLAALRPKLGRTKFKQTLAPRRVMAPQRAVSYRKPPT